MPRQTLLQLADMMGRQEPLFARDLVHRVFPQSTIAISDRDIAGVRRCLSDWIFAIERALFADQPDTLAAMEGRLFPLSWETLTASDLLSDVALVQEARVRLLLWQFAQPANGDLSGQKAKVAPSALLPLAADANPMVADAAMRLISAHLRDQVGPPGQLVELPADIVHLLLWRVVAAHEVMTPGQHSALQVRVPAILAAHDEGQGHGRSAQYLAHKMMELHRVDAERPALKPATHGMALPLALLALASGLPFGRVAEFAMEAGLARLTVTMRALGYDEQEAGAMLGWIVGRLGHENAALLSLSAFAATPRDAAQAQVAQWREASVLRENAA